MRTGRWGSFAGGRLTTPKSGKDRSVPMAPDVARALARLPARGYWTGDDGLVFPGILGSYVERPDEAELVAAAFAVDSPGLRRTPPAHTAGPP